MSDLNPEYVINIAIAFFTFFGIIFGFLKFVKKQKVFFYIFMLCLVMDSISLGMWLGKDFLKPPATSIDKETKRCNEDMLEITWVNKIICIDKRPVMQKDMDKQTADSTVRATNMLWKQAKTDCEARKPPKRLPWEDEWRAARKKSDFIIPKGDYEEWTLNQDSNGNISIVGSDKVYIPARPEQSNERRGFRCAFDVSFP